jgi:acetyltransferase-like isoleucine patch superfamily enzyme
MALDADRRLPHDWYDGRVPAGVEIHPEAYVESAFCFSACRSRRQEAVRIERGAHIYSSTIFDLGEDACVRIGECSMLNGARLVCEGLIEIGAYATISWNVIFMDSYRLPFEPAVRRALLRQKGAHGARNLAVAPSWPIRLHDNVWIGFDVCVLPGVTIGEGSVVGARSVVNADVPAYTVVAGNPARVVRELPRTAAGAEP